MCNLTKDGDEKIVRKRKNLKFFCRKGVWGHGMRCGSYSGRSEKKEKGRLLPSFLLWWRHRRKRRVESEPPLALLGVQGAIRSLGSLPIQGACFICTLHIVSHPNVSPKQKRTAYAVRFVLVETVGIEPMTSCMSSMRSNQLSYASATHDIIAYAKRFVKRF